MSMWSPFRGCKKISEGCKYCYIHKGDEKRGVDTSKIVKTTTFNKPIEKNKNGTYKMKSGICYMCFSTDFLIDEADSFRMECYEMIKERNDVTFLFLTKRIDRFMKILPSDWGNGYDNIVVGCTIENQKNADYRLKIFNELPIKHKDIIIQPMLECINISPYLDNIELVVVGGEYGENARVLDYEWVLDIRRQCIEKNVNFEFRQCATHFIKNEKTYKLSYRELMSQAKKANINYKVN